MIRAGVIAVLLAACGFTATNADPRADAALDGAVITDALGGQIVDAAIDAPAVNLGTCNPAACAFAGGTCASNVCEISSSGQGAVACPAGMQCRVSCVGSNACKGGVLCSFATTCDVTCFGSGACQDFGVDCGNASTCDVLCRGSNACQHGLFNVDSVKCRDASCAVTCDGSGACQDGISAQGTCAAHCCDGACQDGVGSCTRDAVCP